MSEGAASLLSLRLQLRRTIQDYKQGADQGNVLEEHDPAARTARLAQLTLLHRAGRPGRYRLYPCGAMV